MEYFVLGVIFAGCMLAIWNEFCKTLARDEKRARRRRVRSARPSYLDEQEHQICMQAIKRG